MIFPLPFLCATDAHLRFVVDASSILPLQCDAFHSLPEKGDGCSQVAEYTNSVNGLRTLG